MCASGEEEFVSREGVGVLGLLLLLCLSTWLAGQKGTINTY